MKKPAVVMWLDHRWNKECPFCRTPPPLKQTGCAWHLPGLVTEPGGSLYRVPFMSIPHSETNSVTVCAMVNMNSELSQHQPNTPLSANFRNESLLSAIFSLCGDRRNVLTRLRDKGGKKRDRRHGFGPPTTVGSPLALADQVAISIGRTLGPGWVDWSSEPSSRSVPGTSVFLDLRAPRLEHIELLPAIWDCLSLDVVDFRVHSSHFSCLGWKIAEGPAKLHADPLYKEFHIVFLQFLHLPPLLLRSANT